MVYCLDCRYKASAEPLIYPSCTFQEGITMARPDILVFMCDQLNAGVLSCYGGQVPTPNIDALAQTGVRFSSAVCPTPFCSPSRASMITGVYPHSHGITYNVNKRDYPAISSPDTEEGIWCEDITTDRLLHEEGYETHHYGKFHLMDDTLPYYPDMFGEHHEYEKIMRDTFEQVRSRDPSEWMDWYDWILPVKQSTEFAEAAAAVRDRWEGTRLDEFIAKMGMLELPWERTFDYMTAERTVQMLEKECTGPRMITCSFNYPHDPNVVPERYYSMFDPSEVSLPANYETLEERFEGDRSRRILKDLGETGVREFSRIYFGCVKMIDDLVGRVMDGLERSGRLDNTIVVFTADHGDMCGGHGMVWKSTSSFYEEVVRVPLIIRFPGKCAPRVAESPVNLTDIMPTLLEAAGAEVPAHVEGVSMWPMICGDKKWQDFPEYTFSERLAVSPDHSRAIGPERDGHFMIRSRDWKFCRYSTGEEFLYSLRDDPGETADVSGVKTYTAVKETLAAELDRWLASRSADNYTAVVAAARNSTGQPES